MSTIDWFLRPGMFALALLLSILLLRNCRHTPAGLLGALFVFGGGCDQLMPILVHKDVVYLVYPIHLLSLATVVSFWLLSKALFEDRFRWHWGYLVLYLYLVISSLVGHKLIYGDFKGPVHWVLGTPREGSLWALVPFMAVMVALLLLAVRTAVKDWRNDLVETRRRARMIFVVIIAAAVLVISVTEFLVSGTPMAGLADTIGVGISFFLLLGFSAWFLEFRWDSQASDEQPIFLSQRVSGDSPEHDPFSPVAKRLAKLEGLMNEQKVYREEGLTIGRLAEKMVIQEYQLRRLINGQMQQRNFNQFLNGYRIRDASARLVAPETRHLPVLTIALEVGYRSMAPFNKAFREIHGMTPTEYRKANLA